MRHLSGPRGGRLRLIAVPIVAAVIVAASIPASAAAQFPGSGQSGGGGMPGSGQPGSQSGGTTGITPGQMQGNVQSGGMNTGGPPMTSALLMGITLTKTQQDSVSNIKTNLNPQIQAAQSSQNTVLVSQLVQQRNSAIRNLLTSSQQSIFDQNLATFQANNGPMGGGIQY